MKLGYFQVSNFAFSGKKKNIIIIYNYVKKVHIN